MKKQQILAAVSAGLIVLGMVGSADAALVGRLAASEGGTDYQAYYDDVADLTWLADASYDPRNRAEGWTQAMNAISGYTVDGVGGWRLPTIADGCLGYDCTGSELGNMFYNVLGGVKEVSIVDTHNANYDLFTNVKTNGYWSSTLDPDVAGNAFLIQFANGWTESASGSVNKWSWGVQSGDVSAVPVPAAAWLFGSGLIGLIGVARRRKS